MSLDYKRENISEKSENETSSLESIIILNSYFIKNQNNYLDYPKIQGII